MRFGVVQFYGKLQIGSGQTSDRCGQLERSDKFVPLGDNQRDTRVEEFLFGVEHVERCPAHQRSIPGARLPERSPRRAHFIPPRLNFGARGIEGLPSLGHSFNYLTTRFPRLRRDAVN